MNKDSNVRGILLMIASMSLFALADTLVKLSTSIISPAQVLFYLIGGSFVLFALMALLQNDRLNDPRAFSSTVGAITQASPLLATVGAVLFLNEYVGWRRWCAIVIGFFGVLLIIQPGAIEFDFAVLWAILALAALSIRDLTTRLIPADIPSFSLATYTMAVATPFTILWVIYNGESLFPAQTDWIITIPMVVLGAIGYMFLISSIRVGEVSIVMPFRYSRIIFLLILGMIIFNEKPSLLMLLGAILIISSGTFMMWRERLVKNSVKFNE